MFVSSFFFFFFFFFFFLGTFGKLNIVLLVVIVLRLTLFIPEGWVCCHHEEPPRLGHRLCRNSLGPTQPS